MEAVDLELPPDPQGDNIADGYPTKMIGVCVASIWLLAAASAPVGGYITVGGEPIVVELDGLKSYMIVVGATGLVIAALTLMMIKCLKGPLEKKLCTLRRTPLNLQQFIAIFLLLWWGAGAGIGSFQGPYIETSNGYFALWIGFGCSLAALGDCFEDVQRKITQGRARIAQTGVRDDVGIAASAIGLFFAALVLLLALIKPVDEARRGVVGAYTWEPAFGMVSACLTLPVTLLLKCTEEKPCVLKFLVILLAVDWIATAGICTFRGPFLGTGNGFFACYIALFFCFQLVANKFFEK